MNIGEECYCFAGGAVKSYPIGSMEDAFALKREHPDWVLLGERGGAKVEGCDLGNSPWDAMNYDFRGKTMIHSTSAGTQGIVNAARASATQIITGSLQFFDPALAHIFPREDYPLCVALNRFGFVLRVEKEGDMLVIRREEVAR